MSVKIRLQRHGKKGKPFYWIVAADARSKRDGRYLEKLGIYNPNTNPATIELDVNGAVTWLQNGAQPTNTARAILSYKGAMLKNHLAGGIKKGALTEEQAEKKFEAWVKEKEAQVEAKADGLAKAKADAKQKALEAEKAVNEARTAIPPPVPEEVAETEASATEEAPAEEVAETEGAVVEEAAEKVVEAEKSDVKEEVSENEAPAKEVVEAKKPEVVEEVAENEAPAEEAKASNEEE
jgi:small subunit ribosomal protein S16